MKNTPATHDLILIGGGHAHALAVRMLAMKPPVGTRITLISPQPLAPYSGMLPGLIAGHYQHNETHIDLPQLCLWAGVRFIRQTVSHLDTPLNRITLADGSDIDYDWVSLNIGGVPSWHNVPGAAEHAIAVKPISNFYPRWNRFLDTLSTNDADKEHTLVVVGGGAGGCELILAMAHAVARRGLSAHFKLITQSLLPEFSNSARRTMRAALRHYRIELLDNTQVTSVTENTLVTGHTLHCDRQSVAYNSLFWCTGVQAPSWLENTNLDRTEAGFIKVNAQLRSVSHSNVFAAGDCAWQVNHPAPRAGVYAVRQSALLAHNLSATIQGGASKAFLPQRHFLSLMSLGDKKAIAYRNGFSLSTDWLWRVKHRIDKAFIEKLNILPERPLMPAPEQDSERCTGCGAKIGGLALRSALTGVAPVEHQNIIAGFAQREDASVIRWENNALLVQSHDYFPAFIDDPYLFGRIAALHSLSDVHARNATPHSALATVCIPVHHPTLQSRDLSRLMRGAVQELNRAGCALIGGHTIEGPQLSAGFTINASAQDHQLLGKSGAAVGDKLLLTKPLGTGILLAAMMKPTPVGQYLDAMFEQMLISNGHAAAVFHQHHALAVTDITGFGLLGHLLEICDASNVGALLHASAVPIMDGVITLVQQGIHSTLKGANDAALTRCRIASPYLSHPLLAVLTDPQTSGGLLACVPSAQSQQCAHALREQGQSVWEIGEVTQGNGIKVH